jgi:elongation factor 1-gamma
MVRYVRNLFNRDVNTPSAKAFEKKQAELKAAASKPAAPKPAAAAPAEAKDEKAKNPLDLLPPSAFILDAWKRFYSNNEVRPDSIKYFWENFDREGYSIWKVNYKYNSELTLTFMSANLIGGFFQRIERARKYAFGSMLVLGENNNNEISGYFVFRGQDVPFEITDAPDYESFEFTRANIDDAKVRESFEDYLAWDGKLDGKKFCDGKIFK